MANWGKKIRHRFSKKQEYTEVSAYKISKFTRREIIMTIVTVLAITSFALGTSYAIFSDIETSSNYNIVESGNLEIAFDHTEDGIGNVLSLNNAYPMSDSDGLLQTGYTFKVTNTGTLDSDYSVKVLDDDGMIEADGCASNLLDKSKIKVSIDGSTPVLLSALEASNWVIQTGKLKTNETVTHTIRMWIDINSGNEVLGKHYHGKILVTATNDEPPTPTSESCFMFASGTITGYSSDPSCPKDVVIPSTINGEEVITIGESAFGYYILNSDTGEETINPNYVPITSVVIPDSVITIGNFAFIGEVDFDTGDAKGTLTSVVIGENVTTIGVGAFAGNSLTEVVIPDSVTTIGANAFSYNQLTEVEIRNSVTTIGGFAFQFNQLTEVSIPNSVTTIGEWAFSLNQLTSVVIGNSVITIGENAFDFNLNLNTIRILGKSSATDFVSLGTGWNGTCTNIIYEP